MPKKRRPNLLNTKPQSSAPSTLRGAHSVPALARTDGESVNDLLSHLRISQGQGAHVTAPAQTRVISSVHPSLRSILDIPEPPALTPGPGARRGGGGLSRRRYIAGPPPPASWTRENVRTGPQSDFWNSKFSRRVQDRAPALPGGRECPPPHSLQHYAWKAMAVSWDLQSAETHSFIGSYFSTAIKELFVSYVSVYNDHLWINSLECLFQEDMDKVTRLDLCNQINISDVEIVGKALVRNWPNLGTHERRSLEDETPDLSLIVSTEVPESWEAADAEEASSKNTASGFSIPLQPATTLRFPNLVHLSLALNPSLPTNSHADWLQLLALASELSTIQSLSLAYWPVPSYTPKTVISSKGDLREAASILRLLSRSLYCLKWFELTGCATWSKALIWSSQGVEDEDHGSPAPIDGIDWNGSWRNIEFLGLGPGWIPDFSSNTVARGDPSSANTPEHSLFYYSIDAKYGFDKGDTARLMVRLQDHFELRASPNLTKPAGVKPHDTKTKAKTVHALETWDVQEEREKVYRRKEVEAFMQFWVSSREVANRLRQTRAAKRGKYIEFDFGAAGSLD